MIKILGSALAATAVATMLLAGCNGMPSCKDKVLQEKPSPNGSTIAAFFERNCGATVSPTYHVALRDAAKTFDPKDETSVVFSKKHMDTIGMSWKDETALVIRTEAPKSEIFLKQVEWKTVRITYE